MTTAPEALTVLASLADDERTAPELHLNLEPFDALAAFPTAEWEVVESGLATWLQGFCNGVHLTVWPAEDHRHTKANRVVCWGVIEASQQMGGAR
jgi:hypothetical protein